MKLNQTTLSLTMTVLLLAGGALLPLASAREEYNSPNTLCPSASNLWSGWQYVTGSNPSPTFRCLLGPGQWLYCQYVSDGVDHCWIVIRVLTHEVVSETARLGYPVVHVPSPVDPAEWITCPSAFFHQHWDGPHCHEFGVFDTSIE